MLPRPMPTAVVVADVSHSNVVPRHQRGLGSGFAAGAGAVSAAGGEMVAGAAGPVVDGAPVGAAEAGSPLADGVGCAEATSATDAEARRPSTETNASLDTHTLHRRVLHRRATQLSQVVEGVNDAR